jgi:hypothetical protein
VDIELIRDMQKLERLVKSSSQGGGGGNTLCGIFRKICAANNQSIGLCFHASA